LNNPLKYSDPTGYSAYSDPWTDASWFFKSLEQQVGEQFDQQYNDFLPSLSSGAGYGKAGEGENGKGKNGIYYDWKTGKFRRNDNNDEVDPQTAMAILQQNARDAVAQTQRSNVIVGLSIDATLALASLGYTIEGGVYLDDNEGNQFFSHGQTFGLEASAGFNFIMIKPKSNFKFTDLEGAGASAVYNIGFISISIFGNSSPTYSENSVFDTYYGIKIGIGPGAGGSASPNSKTSFFDWIPDMTKSFFHWK